MDLGCWDGVLKIRHLTKQRCRSLYINSTPKALGLVVLIWFLFHLYYLQFAGFSRLVRSYIYRRRRREKKTAESEALDALASIGLEGMNEDDRDAVAQAVLAPIAGAQSDRTCRHCRRSSPASGSSAPSGAANQPQDEPLLLLLTTAPLKDVTVLQLLQWVGWCATAGFPLFYSLHSLFLYINDSWYYILGTQLYFSSIELLQFVFAYHAMTATTFLFAKRGSNHAAVASAPAPVQQQGQKQWEGMETEGSDESSQREEHTLHVSVTADSSNRVISLTGSSSGAGGALALLRKHFDFAVVSCTIFLVGFNLIEMLCNDTNYPRTVLMLLADFFLLLGVDYCRCRNISVLSKFGAGQQQQPLQHITVSPVTELGVSRVLFSYGRHLYAQQQQRRRRRTVSSAGDDEDSRKDDSVVNLLMSSNSALTLSSPEHELRVFLRSFIYNALVVGFICGICIMYFTFPCRSFIWSAKATTTR